MAGVPLAAEGGIKMKTLAKIIFLAFIILSITYYLSPTAYVEAAVPRLINYQGRLTDTSGNPLNGTYTVVFRIYDVATAGSPLWQGTYSVSIQKGIFNVLLGDINDAGFNFANLNFDKQYYLGIKVGSDAEMTPRQLIASSGYAINSENTYKIRADSNDTASGYLSEKVDNSTIRINTSTHKIYAAPEKQLFTSSGNFTVSVGATAVYITMCGGGGGGGGGYDTKMGGGGGGGGGYTIKYLHAVTPGNNYTVTIGSGGVGGIGNNNGVAGGTTSFGNVSVTGGGGGKMDIGAGGVGGGVGLSGGTAPAAGGFSFVGGNGGSVGMSIGGGGAGSPFGVGGAGGAFGQNGNDASGYGSGGGGAGQAGKGSSKNGGNGKSGICIVEW
jgi:hypothetical protein